MQVCDETSNIAEVQLKVQLPLVTFCWMGYRQLEGFLCFEHLGFLEGLGLEFFLGVIEEVGLNERG